MSDSPIVFLESALFKEAVRQHRQHYSSASPFPHAVIDNFLPETIANQLADEFPGPKFSGFKQPDNEYQQGKLGRVQDNDFQGVPSFTRHMLNELNGKVFLDFLETMTGISGLIGDPHFHGGALHQILPGGKLAIHADFNLDKRRKLDRRVNVLIYLNRNWRDEYGGHLELWDERMTRYEKKISPIFNRCIIFNTTSNSYHGHPDPLRCPEGMTRNSIALYYYTNGRPANEAAKPHSTLWKARPGEEFSGKGGKMRSWPQRLKDFWDRTS
jgi:Rps23 Pro-64 3,4-dihydroxylase Tpa1-like proline 4-hydroxylase